MIDIKELRAERAKSKETYNPIPSEVYEEVMKAFRAGKNTYSYYTDEVEAKEQLLWWEQSCTFVVTSYYDVELYRPVRLGMDKEWFQQKVTLEFED